MTARATEYAKDHPELAFATFMDRVDRAVLCRTGLSVFDFADACWADLFEDYKHVGLTDDVIFECLAEADELFARMLRVE